MSLESPKGGQEKKMVGLKEHYFPRYRELHFSCVFKQRSVLTEIIEKVDASSSHIIRTLIKQNFKLVLYDYFDVIQMHRLSSNCAWCGNYA